MNNTKLVSPPEAHYTVYKLTSPDNKVYIGCTGNPVKKRWNGGRGYRGSPVFEAICHYGWPSFKKEILCEKLTKAGAEKLEAWFVAYYDSMNPEKGYNRVTGGSRKGGHLSENMKQKCRESKIRQYEEQPELIERIRGSVLAAYANDPTYRERVGRAICSVYENDPGYRERVSKGIRAAYEKNPAIRTRLADISKQFWQDPDYRSRVTESMAAYYDGNPEVASKIQERNRHYYREHPERRREIAEQMSRYLNTPEGRKFLEADTRPRPVRCVETGAEYPSQRAAERATGFSSIHKACSGLRRTAGGYHWVYICRE